MAKIAAFRGALLNPHKVDAPNAAAVPLTGVKSKLAKAELVRDSHASVYRYHQTFPQHGMTVTRKTVIVAIELEPWSTGVIRAHEQTSTMARDLATRGITNEGAHTEALFCGYRDSARDIDGVLASTEKQQPALAIATGDGTVHKVWRESNPDVIAELARGFADRKLHVLDGHGRYEGMLAYRDALGDLPARSQGRFGLACLVNVEDPTLELVPRHRVVRGPRSRSDVLTAAKPFFKFERIDGAAENVGKQRAALEELGDQQGFLALFPDDPDAWRLSLLPDVAVDGQKIDPVVIESVFLKQVVSGANARSVLEPSTVFKAVDDGAVGLIVRPIAMEHLLRADETGQLLPFGSTAFRPALARIVNYLIDPTEQL